MVRAAVPGDPFEALGDTNRREILRLLSDGDKPVREIADAMSISRPAVSRHLRLLKDAGMVAEEARGTRRNLPPPSAGSAGRPGLPGAGLGRRGDAVSLVRREHRRRGKKMSSSLKMSFEVACSAEHAFRTWTAEIGTWWPSDHTVTGEADLRIVIQGRVGGRIYERTADGVEHDWGEVTVWGPPRNWAICGTCAKTARMLLRSTSALSPWAPTRTRVQIEHSGWERLGAVGEERRAKNLVGWETLLPHFRAAVARGGE